MIWYRFYGRFHHNGAASHGRFRMAVHHRGIYRSVLLHFRIKTYNNGLENNMTNVYFNKIKETDTTSALSSVVLALNLSY